MSNLSFKCIKAHNSEHWHFNKLKYSLLSFFFSFLTTKYNFICCTMVSYPSSSGSPSYILLTLTNKVSCGKPHLRVSKFTNKRLNKLKTSVVLNENQCIFNCDLLLLCSQHYLPHNICVQSDSVCQTAVYNDHSSTELILK